MGCESLGLQSLKDAVPGCSQKIKLKRGTNMATKKMKPKKTNKSKLLRKAKKIEATKPLGTFKVISTS
jgi:hypothetical protein